MTIHIRAATASDVSLIGDLIRELAIYEKLSDQVMFTQVQLEAELFGPSPAAFALIAEYQHAPAGFVLWFHNFSTFLGKRGIYIEDLYVRPEYRGHGIGKALFKAVVQRAIALGCARVEWQVLDWNRPAIDFYGRLGAHHKSQWQTYQLTGEALANAGV